MAERIYSMSADSKIILHRLMDLSPLHSASGLVKIDNQFYVIADDELSLWSFDPSGNRTAHPILEGQLPKDLKDRKRMKPDWEALAYQPDVGLWIVPSGATLERTTGFLVDIRNHQVHSKKKLDFTTLYRQLAVTFPELNIEGAVVTQNSLRLLQRGNGSLSQNAIISVDLNLEKILSIAAVDLGHRNGIPLGFTDACRLDDQLFFLAVAEDAASTYEDGKFLGAVLGCLNANNEVIFMTDLDIPTKPEGLWLEKSSAGILCYIVTDADDPSSESVLYQGEVLKSNLPRR